jgi:hypothetical protein
MEPESDCRRDAEEPEMLPEASRARSLEAGEGEARTIAPLRMMLPAATVRVEAELTVPREAVAEGLGEEKEKEPLVTEALVSWRQGEQDRGPPRTTGEAVARLTEAPAPVESGSLIASIKPVVRLPAAMMVMLPLAEAGPLPPEKTPIGVEGVPEPAGVEILPELREEPEKAARVMLPPLPGELALAELRA